MYTTLYVYFVIDFKICHIFEKSWKENNLNLCVWHEIMQHFSVFRMWIPRAHLFLSSLVAGHCIIHDAEERKQRVTHLHSLLPVVPRLSRCIPLTHFIPDSGELQGQFPLLHDGTLALKCKHIQWWSHLNCTNGFETNTCTTVVHLTQDWVFVIVCPPGLCQWVQNEEL